MTAFIFLCAILAINTGVLTYLVVTGILRQSNKTVESVFIYDPQDYLMFKYATFCGFIEIMLIFLLISGK